MRTGIIYIATNKINGKSYIGQTIGHISKRISRHHDNSKNHKYAFANALRKYNKSDWEWKTLYNNIPCDKLDIAEMCAIYLYDTYYCGYNSTLGGEDNPMRYSEFRKKVSESKIGKKRPDQAIRVVNVMKNRKISDLERHRRSESTSGKNNPMFGKNHKDDSRLKISKNLGSRQFNVYKDNILVGTWINKKDCARKLGIDNSQITKYLKGKNKNSLGYIFVYQETKCRE